MSEIRSWLGAFFIFLAVISGVLGGVWLLLLATGFFLASFGGAGAIALAVVVGSAVLATIRESE